MIELGREVFEGTTAPFNTANMHAHSIEEKLFSVVAKAQSMGKPVAELLAPLLAPTEAEEAADPERQARIAEMQYRLAAKFSRKDRRLWPTDFSPVYVARGSDVSTVVVLTTQTGLYRGSFNSIMSTTKRNTNRYTINVGDQTIDTRQVMTRKVHRAMVVQAMAEYLNAPDSLPTLFPDDGQSEFRHGTWYTGADMDEGQAPFCYDSVAFPTYHYRDPNSATQSMTFRPGVVLPS